MMRVTDAVGRERRECEGGTMPKVELGWIVWIGDRAVLYGYGTARKPKILKPIEYIV
jgi:hypothetical protein